MRKQPLQKVVLGKQRIDTKKYETGPLSYAIYKNKSRLKTKR